MSKSKKTESQRPVRGCIAFDFDGVLHEKFSYALTFGEVNVEMIHKAHERGYAVAVMTCNDVDRVARELRRHGLRCLADMNMTRAFWHDPEVVLVTNRKISAHMYVDDKAVNYRYGEPTERVFAALDELEGFRSCGLGQHWGRHGGAGVLPWTEFRGQLYVLMGKRSRHVQQPGTWGGFGGALDAKSEDTWDAALRELDEEVKGVRESVADWSDCYVYQCPGCDWGYTTFLAEVLSDDPGEDQAAWLPEARVRDRWETDRLRWVRVADVDGYDLHPAFAEAWPELRRALENYVAADEQVA